MYIPNVILRRFIVRIQFRLNSNNALHTFLIIDCCQYKHQTKLTPAFSLVIISGRFTFDRRLKTKTISKNIQEWISTMGHLYICYRAFLLVDLPIIAIDSTLLKSKSSVWCFVARFENHLTHQSFITITFEFSLFSLWIKRQNVNK